MGEGINCKNNKGQTPLDVLCDSWQYFDDVSLVTMIRTVGGMRAVELIDLESIRTELPSKDTSSISQTGMIEQPRDGAKMAGEQSPDDTKLMAESLLVVATLVATITFQAIINPPGGFVQGSQPGNLPRGELASPLLPDGAPVLRDHLTAFYVFNSIGLFLSVSVVLLLLCGVQKSNRFLLNVMVSFVWSSIFFTSTGFISAFYALYASRKTPFVYVWTIVLLSVSFGTFLVASIWVATRVIKFILLLGTSGYGPYGSLTGWRSVWEKTTSLKDYWDEMLRRLDPRKLKEHQKKIVTIVSIVGVLAIVVVVNVGFFVSLILSLIQTEKGSLTH